MTRRSRFLVPWAWSAVATAPFLAVYVAHYFCIAGPTGFIGYDQAYYVANAREIFERGNGLAYPNPYDPDPESPVIYFHLLLWPIGLAVARLGLDPGVTFVALGVLAALAASRVTWSLVVVCLDGAVRPPIPFLLVMWGGGLFAAAAIVVNLWTGVALLHGSMRFDPVDGWWFLNWGRNLVYSLEAAYHALMAACWLGVLHRRWLVSAITAGVLAASHPFSGFQCLAILTVWCALSHLRRADRPPVWFSLSIVAELLAFVTYNFYFLNQFEGHRELVERWSLPWVLDARAILLGYGPVLALAVAGVALGVRERRGSLGLSTDMAACPSASGSRLSIAGAWEWLRCAIGDVDRRWQFLGVAFLVSFLLSKHEWFVAPRQPLHFTRGYAWLPLCLIGLPAAARATAWLTSRGWLGRGLVGSACVLALLDNTLWLVEYARRCDEYGLFLSSDVRSIFQGLDGSNRGGVLASSDGRLEYLAATYTAARPYAGHITNSPQWSDRRRRVDSLGRSDPPGEWFDAIDMLLVRATDRARYPDWRVLDSAGDWVLLGR